MANNRLRDLWKRQWDEDPLVLEDTEEEFEAHKQWGGFLTRLGPEHIEALKAGKILALNVNDEFTMFVFLEE